MRSMSAITATELKILNTTAILNMVSPLPPHAIPVMELDTVENKLYFQDGKSISRLNLNDDYCVEVLVKNATAFDMVIDRIGGRLFWIEYMEESILVANLNGTEKRVQVNSTREPHIALDPLER